MKLVWLIDPAGIFENEWLEYLFQDVTHITHTDLDHDCIHEDAVFVFNHTFPYEEYFTNYAEERVSYGVVHLSDETLGDTCDYLKHKECVFAFRNYYHPIFSQNPKVVTFGLGYKCGFMSIPRESHVWPWYHWCFAGAIYHEQRRNALTAFQYVKPYFLFVGEGFNRTSLSIDQYRRMMEISKFALCPIGQGNLDTFRLYEAMEAGCIPVTLSHTELQHFSPSYWHIMFRREEVPFVMGASWEECMTKVENLLKDPNDYRALQTKMIEFWEGLKHEWRAQVIQNVEKLLSSSSL